MIYKASNYVIITIKGNFMKKLKTTVVAMCAAQCLMLTMSANANPTVPAGWHQNARYAAIATAMFLAENSSSIIVGLMNGVIHLSGNSGNTIAALSSSASGLTCGILGQELAKLQWRNLDAGSATDTGFAYTMYVKGVGSFGSIVCAAATRLIADPDLRKKVSGNAAEIQRKTDGVAAAGPRRALLLSTERSALENRLKIQAAAATASTRMYYFLYYKRMESNTRRNLQTCGVVRNPCQPLRDRLSLAISKKNAALSTMWVQGNIIVPQSRQLDIRMTLHDELRRR